MQVVLAFQKPRLLVDGALAGQLTLGLTHVLAADRPPGKVQAQEEAAHHRPAFHLVGRLAHHRRQLLTRVPGVVGKLLGDLVLEEDALGGLLHPRAIIGHRVCCYCSIRPPEKRAGE